MAENYDLDEELQEKPFDRGLFLRMITYLRPFKKQVAIVSAFVIVNLAVGLLDPYLVKVAIDKGIVKSDFGVVNKVGLTYLGLYLLSCFCGIIRTKVINRTAQGILYNLRRELFEHMQTLSFRFFDGRPAGKIMSRVTNDVQAIAEMINGGLVTIISESLNIIGILVIIFLMNVKLALMAVIVIPFLALVVLKLQPSIETAWTKVRKSTANINANLNETILGVRVVQAFSRQRKNIEIFHGVNTDNYHTNMRAIRLELFVWPLVEITGMIGTTAVIWYGAVLVMNGQASIGSIIAFINYLWRFWGPISAISRVYSQVLGAMASSERIFQILDTEPEVKDAPDAEELTTIAGDIRFEKVSFGYNPNERMVLHDIDLHGKPGQVIALVGPTGAGKSSIINLLMRFYDPTKGRILIDGTDIAHATLASLRSQVGLVLQESFIFSGTIEDNIRFGKPDATDEEIQRVADAIRVSEFASKFPDGLKTEVEERGARLSAGQRQLVAFARALLADPRILVLDEATSSVDTETEKVIQEALKRLLAGRTAIIIAHRLSTIEHADQILVIDQGRIVEAGSHKELLLKQGLYYQLHLKQFQLEDEDSIAV